MVQLKRSLAMAVLALGTTLCAAAEHEPSVLGRVSDRVVEAVQANARPVVVFDLDDTLLNTRARNLRIIRELAASADFEATYPDAVPALRSLRLESLKYALKDSLRAAGIVDPELITRAQAFWLSRFFSNDYAAFDLPIIGAVEYVNRLHRAGATIVYLTGRDVPRMGLGTEESLRMLGLPLSAEGAILLMKPDPAIDDLLFKEEAIERIRGLGEVVAVFENEPANLNALQAGFPAAQAVFVDTIHSPRPDVPNAGIPWVHDFRVRE